MSNRVSMADIGRRLGVSQATVSYVLNDPDTEMVGAAMRERVLETAREMGYRPNRAAQSLKGRPSRIIQLCVHAFYPAFYARVLYEFEALLGPTPYQLYVVHPYSQAGNEHDQVDTGWPTDGVIMCDGLLYPQTMALLAAQRIPVVSLGLAPVTAVDHVGIDALPALQSAMRHLLAREGRVAYLSPWDAEVAQSAPDPRFRAYRAAMREAGRAEEIIVSPDRKGPGTRLLAREVVYDYVQKNGCPAAIFCFNDERTIAALDALRALGYRVPQDVLLIGHDGIDETAFHAPPLSTVAFPFQEAARLAWQFLQRRIEAPEIPLQSVTLTAPLLWRDSSRCE